jgi:UDP-glucose 4-epimerase
MASSMAVYADSPTPMPISETYRTRPISPYGIAKLAAEQNCLTICPQLGIEPVVLRLFNTFGTRQTFTPYVGVINIFIRKLLSGVSPVVFGDGEQCRDFVYVRDVAAAFRDALESDATDCVLNIGTGQATSVNQIAKMLQSRINENVDIQRAPAAPGELRNCIADITTARRRIGYQPTSSIEDRIEEVITHIKAEL